MTAALIDGTAQAIAAAVRTGTVSAREIAHVTVVLEDFLGWCSDRKIRPSEAALDVFAQDSVLFLSSATGGPLINLA